jgi:hypothetical protein
MARKHKRLSPEQEQTQRNRRKQKKALKFEGKAKK